MDGPHPVVEGLRRTLASPRSPSAFAEELESRVRQLLADMVDGRVLPRPEANALRASIVELVRIEALPKLAIRNPDDALRVLDKLKAYGFTQLEGERPQLEAARAAKFPPPPAITWPELAELHAAAQRHPDACSVAPGIRSAYFVKELQNDGISLPDQLPALYAACNGFDLSCVGAPHIPVFSLLPSESVDIFDEKDGYPRRAVVFQGGDDVQLSVYRDRKKQWWLVYEHELLPINKKPLDLRELVRFGLERMNAPIVEVLDGGALSWDRLFGIRDG
jgi:hypothetical protein